MKSITIEIPGDIVATMKLPKKRIKKNLLIDIAASLYQQGIFLINSMILHFFKLNKWEFQKEMDTRQIKKYNVKSDLKKKFKFTLSHQ